MSDASNVARSLRERLSGTTEERLGKALSDLLENPLLTGAIGRAFDAREKAVQAQEVAMGALNIPSASDIERLTRRLRSVSNRLEGIEDGVDRLDRAQPSAAADNLGIDQRLSAIEAQLKRLTDKLDQSSKQQSAAKANTSAGKTKASAAKAKAGTGPGKAKAGAAKAKTGRAKPAKA
jgi:chromosome segregation ATPase